MFLCCQVTGKHEYYLTRLPQEWQDSNSPLENFIIYLPQYFNSLISNQIFWEHNFNADNSQ